MKELLFTGAALWGLSGIAVIIMFVLDERAHRRSIALHPPADVVQPTESAACPAPENHVDHAFV